MKKSMLTVAAIMGIAFAAIFAFSALSNSSSKADTKSTPTPTKEIETKEMIKIGVTQIVSHPSLDNCRQGFIDGLAENGYIEGENVEFIISDAQGEISNTTAIARNLVSQDVKLICAISTPSAQSVATAIQNTEIPLIFNAASDPIGAGLINEDLTSNGNITGVSDALPVKKQLELIRSLLPQAKKIGILYSASEVNSQAQVEEYKQEAPKMGFEIVASAVSNINEISAATQAILKDVDCLQNVLDNMVVSALPTVLKYADENNVPVFGSEVEQVKGGCLASEGIDYYELGKQCAQQAVKILNGTSANTIPYETIINSSLFINKSEFDKLDKQPAFEEILDRAELV